MAFGKPLDPINENVEIEAIDEVLRAFQDGSKTIVDKITAQIAAAQKSLDASALKSKEALYKRIADLYAQGIIKTDEQAAALARSELQKQQNEKLRSEIEILQVISKENEAERAKQQYILELEREILVQKAKGNADEAKKKEKELAKQKKKDKREERDRQVAEETAGYEFGDIFTSHFGEFFDALADENHVKKVADENLYNTMKGTLKAVEDSLNVINNAISEYAKYQGSINARLQGVSSYSDAVKTLSSVAFSPLMRAEDLYANLSDIVGQGIVTNVEQRAMFATMKDSIAGTFDVTSDSLKRIIRLQQNDSTAARLGMEAYLTRFLNVYVENTEYLQSTFDNVSSSLLEASAMMYLSNKGGGTGASAELEYVVQKWLGTLSGVGLSDSAAQSIAEAIGQLGSGDVDSLGSSDIQSLIVMAANKVGLSYGEMLNTGLDAKQANDLMLGMVTYLQDVAATGTNVVKNQLAKVFGVTVSDLVAVSNLGQDALDTVHKDMLSYKNMYGELQSQFKELPGRLGIANILENLFANLTYQTGMGIASNPVTYALWKITDMIQGVTGGINVPFISAFGNGFDLNTTVENLMKIAIVGVSTLGNIGKIASGLASIGDGSVLLKKLKVSEGEAKVKSFGGSSMSGGQRQSGSTTSETTYVGNTSGDDYADSASNAANDDAQKDLDKKSADYEDPVIKYLAEELKLPDILDAEAEKLDALVEGQNSIVSAAQDAVAAIGLLVTLMQSGAVEGGVTSGTGTATPTSSTKGSGSGSKSGSKSDDPNAALIEYLGEDVKLSSYLQKQDSKLDVLIASHQAILDSIIAASGGDMASDTDQTSSSSSQAGKASSGSDESSQIAESLNSLSQQSEQTVEVSNNITLESNASALTSSALSSVISEIITQSSKTDSDILSAIAPVTTSLTSIDTSFITLLANLASYNGSVVAGIESIVEQFNIIAEANAFKSQSAYDDYINNISQNLDTTYSTITGDVSNQFEVVKDMMDAKLDVDENGITVQLYFTAPEIIVENKVTPPEVDIPDIEVSPDIDVTTQSPDVNVNPEIEVNAQVPDVNNEIALNPNISVEQPNINVNNDIINTPPEVIVNPEINNVIPNVNVDNQIDNNVTVQSQITNTVPDIEVNPNIELSPNINNDVTLNPEIVNTVPNVEFNPNINVEAEVESEEKNPEFILKPNINFEPNINVNPNINVEPLINVDPQINVENNVIVDPRSILPDKTSEKNPEIIVDNNVELHPEIVNTVPNVNVNNEIFNEAPDVNVSVNTVAPQVINTITFNPNIINTVPDVSVYPEIINTVPEVVLNPEIVTTVTPPVVITQAEIVNTVPNVYVEPKVEAPTPDVDVYVEPILTAETPDVNVMEEVNITAPPAPEVNVIEDITVASPDVNVNPQVEVTTAIPNNLLNPEINVNVPDVNVTEDITVNPPEINLQPQIDVINTVPNINVAPNIINEVAAPDVSVNPEIAVTVPNITVNNEVTNIPPAVNVESNVIIPDADQKDKSNQKTDTDYDRYMLEQGVINNITAANNGVNSDVSDYLVAMDFADGFKILVDTVTRIKTLIENSDYENSEDYSDSEILGFTNYTFNK